MEEAGSFIVGYLLGMVLVAVSAVVLAAAERRRK